jgi:hypothetical protein
MSFYLASLKAVPVLPVGEHEVDSILLDPYEVALSYQEVESFVKATVIQSLDDQPTFGKLDAPLGIASALMALLLRSFIVRFIAWVRPMKADPKWEDR